MDEPLSGPYRERANVDAPAAQQRSGADTERRTFDAQQNLLAWAARVLAEAVKAGTYQDTLIGRHVRAFLETFEGVLAARTLQSYEETLGYLAVEFPTTELVDLTKDDLRGFIARHWGSSAPATKKQRTAAVKSFFRWADDDEGLLGDRKNPAAGLRSPKQPDTNRQAHEEEIITQLIEHQPDPRNRIALQLMGHLGLRRNELRLLKLSDINLTGENTPILVRNGKGGRTRTVYATEQLKTELEMLAQDPDTDWSRDYLIFPWHDASKPYASSSMHDWWKKSLGRAGLPTTMLMHELRHTAATNILKHAKGDHGLIAAQKLLGHKSVKTTETYLHVDDTVLINAIAALG